MLDRDTIQYCVNPGRSARGAFPGSPASRAGAESKDLTVSPEWYAHGGQKRSLVKVPLSEDKP